MDQERQEASWPSLVAWQIDDHVIEPFQRASGDAPLTVAQHIEDLHELIRSRSVDPLPVLLGSFWGAMLALAYAAEHPQSTGPLILVGCGTFDLGARARMQEIIGQRMSTEVRKRLTRAEQLANADERLKAFAEALAPIYSYDPLPSSSGNEEVEAKAQQETWDDMVRLQMEGTYPAAFTNIRVPVLIVHGDYDPHPGHLIRDSLRPALSTWGGKSRFGAKGSRWQARPRPLPQPNRY